MNEYYERKLKQAKRTKSTMPYLGIHLGPTLKPCAVHAKNRNLVLPVDHSYWLDFPMRDSEDCKCSIRQISKHEYQKLKNEGIREQLTAPILNENGEFTGHKEVVFVPINETPVE
ncbi:regulator of ribonuclease activity A [Vibrio cholerae]